MFSVVYGVEWYDERESVVGELCEVHLESPRKFTLSFVKDAWVTHNRRWAQELCETTNLTRLYYKVERPTSEQLNLIGLAVVQATGQTAFHRPKAFDLADPSGYFQSEIPRVMLDGKALTSWANYHSSTNNTMEVRGRVGANPQELTSLPAPPNDRGRTEIGRILGTQGFGRATRLVELQFPHGL